jgi:ribosomal protein L22
MAEKKNEKVEEKKTVKKEEKKIDEAAEKKEIKKEENKIPKKKIAVANGRNLSISKKHAMAICNMIRGKNIQTAIMDLELVLKYKKAVPMKGEIPHRKGKGMMSGRYPINASKTMIILLKSLEGNARVLEINDPKITLAKADKAARPYRRFGSRRFKRTNVLLQAKEK